MHREANLTSPKKGQTSMYNNYFSNFGRPLVPEDLCKDTTPRHPSASEEKSYENVNAGMQKLAQTSSQDFKHCGINLSFMVH